MIKNHTQKYLRFSDLKAQYSLPKSTVYALIKNQGFPKQIPLSSKSVVFSRKAVDAWFAAREAMGVAS